MTHFEPRRPSSPPTTQPEIQPPRRHPRRHSRGALLVGALAGLTLLTSACARTDQGLYASGDPGEATFENLLKHMPVWLGGCTAFVQERKAGGSWINEGGEFVCFFEGFASPVAPRSTQTDPFTARDPGTWRLAYDVGFGCQPDQPLSSEHCQRLTQIVSNEFRVAVVDDHETFCTETGGFWDLGSCGNYFCGAPPICAAVIPGCDCGPDANFVNGIGCVDDPVCVVGDQAQCEVTGGIWDPLSCGHYSCGFRPECAAVIPGCNCGPFAVFDEQRGCLAAPCGAPQ